MRKLLFHFIFRVSTAEDEKISEEMRIKKLRREQFSAGVRFEPEMVIFRFFS
jgi:hypothetical protein